MGPPKYSPGNVLARSLLEVQRALAVREILARTSRACLTEESEAAQYATSVTPARARLVATHQEVEGFQAIVREQSRVGPFVSRQVIARLIHETDALVAAVVITAS